MVLFSPRPVEHQVLLAACEDGRCRLFKYRKIETTHQWEFEDEVIILLFLLVIIFCICAFFSMHFDIYIHILSSLPFSPVPFYFLVAGSY